MRNIEEAVYNSSEENRIKLYALCVAFMEDFKIVNEHEVETIDAWHLDEFVMNIASIVGYSESEE